MELIPLAPFPCCLAAWLLWFYRKECWPRRFSRMVFLGAALATFLYIGSVAGALLSEAFYKGSGEPFDFAPTYAVIWPMFILGSVLSVLMLIVSIIGAVVFRTGNFASDDG